MAHDLFIVNTRGYEYNSSFSSLLVRKRIEMDLLATLGMILVVGYLAGSVARRFQFPRITGYLVIGFLLNPSVLHLVPQATIAKMEIITYLVLGFVSYHIGGGLHFRSMNSLGKAIGWIFLFQVLLSWLLSILLIGFVGPLFVNVPGGTFRNCFFPMALILGAIACASAPAAIVAIILEGKAKGPVTTTTLAVLALTDALTVIAFSVSMEISQPLANGQMDLSLYRAVAVPLLHLGEAALLGIGFGVSLLFAARWIRTPSALLYIVTGTIVLCIGLAEQFRVSSAIASMTIGVMLANLAKRKDMFLVLEDVGDVLFTIFFVLNGMFLDLGGIKAAGVLTGLIILARCNGKYFGARLGARMARAPEAVEKNVGLILLPKAGLTLGLALMAKNAFPLFGLLMFDALVASTMINMLTTPLLAKYALEKAGEGKFG